MSVNKVNSDGSTTLIAGATLWADSPIGTILAYGGATAPAGWFICQGQELTKTEYAELYAVIGDSFGTASVNTKFVLPDLREATTKGVGLTGKSNNHYDSDGVALGEFVEDRVQDHYHYNGGSNASSGSNVAGASGSASGASNNMVVYPTSARKGATTEVKAVGVNYIIKAKQVALPADLESAVEDAVEEMCTDTVTDGDMRPVTSNAVYDATQNLITFSSSASTQAKFHAAMEVAVSAALPKGKSAGLVLYWSGHMQYGGFASNPTNSTLIIGWYYAISSDNSNLTTSTSIYYNYGS